MKKTALILAAMMTLCAASCSAKNTQNSTGSGAAPAQAEQAAEVQTGEKTNGKEIITKDTMVVEGVKAGMTVDEVKAVLGDTENDMEIEDMHILTYGSEDGGCSFIFQKFETLYKDEEKRLAMISVEDNSVKLVNGITIGTSKDDVINAFCADLEDNTPVDMKQNGEKLIYGKESFDELDKLDREHKLNEAKGQYKFGFAMNEQETNGIAYADIDLQSDAQYSYFLMFTFDDENKTDSVMMMMAESNLIDEIISQDEE
ncbi:MAG: hypothetical protein ILP19_10310 [Oscillospiraceae bacterium]|nr:hypothetical protein [Oscillospiraceae bacterium]